jgi:hypothetical protein
LCRLRGSQQAQRESRSSRRSLPSGSSGREESSKTVKKVSWVEIAMQDAQKREASRSRVSSKKVPSHTTGFSFMSEEVVVVVDPVWKAEPLLLWETDLLPSDGGWNPPSPPLLRGSVDVFLASGKYSHIGLVIAQFVARIKVYKIEGQTGVTGTNPTQCHHNGMVLSL